MDYTENITVEILGEEYPLRSSVGKEHIENIARYVDGKMTEIKDATKLKSDKKIAILAALHIADEYIKTQRKIKDLEERILEIQKEQEDILLKNSQMLDQVL